jgi:hypothetical protein
MFVRAAAATERQDAVSTGSSRVSSQSHELPAPTRAITIKEGPTLQAHASWPSPNATSDYLSRGINRLSFGHSPNAHVLRASATAIL